jgi:hypothetical protein
MLTKAMLTKAMLTKAMLTKALLTKVVQVIASPSLLSATRHWLSQQS